jgi:hypothetical protein
MKKLWVWILCAVLLIGVGFALARIIAHKPSIEHQYQFTVTVNVTGDFAVTLTPATLTLTKGETGTITLTNTASGGFDALIVYEVAGLPAGSYSFSKNPVSPGETATLTINTAVLESNRVYVCQLIAKDGMIE